MEKTKDICRRNNEVKNLTLQQQEFLFLLGFWRVKCFLCNLPQLPLSIKNEFQEPIEPHRFTKTKY